MTPTLSVASAINSTAAPGNADSGTVSVTIGGVRSPASVAAVTVTVVSSDEVSSPSLADRRST